ncbi:MAG TPA: hypothetical protein VLV89_12975 [Candidatus Acidoferrum sp.]|nr:hypothetical protein [Candidatus Acidoferrum sp.]
MMRRKYGVTKFISELLIVYFFAGAAGATTLARMDLRQLAQSAQIIIRARCEGSQTRLAGGNIWSIYDFTVLETLKGPPMQSLNVALPGGRIGHVETKVDGAPQFRAGEEVVLFLEKTSDGGYSVTSWAQGTFRVRRGAAGESRLTQDTSHFAVFDPATKSFAPAGIRDISLVEFRKQLTDVLRSQVTRH